MSRMLRVYMLTVPIGTVGSPNALSMRAQGSGGSFFSQASQPQLDARSLEQHADHCMLRKRYGEALEAYQRLVRLQPKNALFNNKLGIAYHHPSGRFGTIVHQSDEKNSATSHFYMANSYASAGNAEGTQEQLRQALYEGFPGLLKALEDQAFDFLTNDSQFQTLRDEAEAWEKAAGTREPPAPSQPVP